MGPVKLASSTQPSEREFLDPIKTSENKTKTAFLSCFVFLKKKEISDRHEEREQEHYTKNNCQMGHLKFQSEQKRSCS